MEFRILGPLQVLDDGREVPLGSPKERELLAVLLLHAGAVVSRERLIDELWGESPPSTAGKALNVHVSQLRKTLSRNGGELIATRPPGYVLEVEPEAVDAARFERLVSDARAEEDAGDVVAASRLLREALALWRGPALEGVELDATTRNEIGRLEELRLGAQMDRIDCEIGLGQHEQVIGELEGLVAAYPLRERLRGQLMLALYRSGRQADALRCYREARETLVGELGIEPSLPLQRLERAILTQDSSLEAPAGVARAARAPPAAADSGRATRRSRMRNWRAAAPALAGVPVVTLVAVFVVARKGDSPRLGPDVIGLLEPGSGRIVAQTPARERPGALAGGQGALWLSAASGSVSRIDLDHLDAVDTIAIGGRPGALAATGNSVWIVDQDSNTVVLVDAAARRAVRRIRVGNGASAIAAGAGALWVTNTIDGTLTRIDPERARAIRTIVVGGEPVAVAVGSGAVWVSDAANGAVIKVDPRTNNAVQSIAVGADPRSIAAAPGGIFVASALGGTVSRIDPDQNVVAATVAVDRAADAVATVGSSVWAASFATGTLARIDPAEGRVTRRVTLGSPVGALASAGGRVALATVVAPVRGGGGILVMSGEDELHPVTLDPATWWSTTGWSILSVTNDGLLTYRRAAGSAGMAVVPDLARSPPVVSGGGTRYTFQLRRGVLYSTGRPVRASDVRASIERLWRLRSPAVNSVPRLGLVGEAQCAKRPARCDLSRAVVTDDPAGAVTFQLSRPNPLFLRLLALPFYDVLPKETAARDGRPLPATGPYRVATYTPGRRLVLVRNNRFHVWSQAAQPEGLPDRIVWRLDRTPARALADVLAGRADYLVPLLPPEEVAALEPHRASQLLSEPFLGIRFAFLNTRIPPFDDIDVRRALNLAVDRGEVARLLGGPLLARPACQVLPPGFPGYRPTCLYTRRPNPSGSWAAPDVGGARALVRRTGTLATPVVVWTDTRPPIVAVARYLGRVLRALGYRTTVRQIPDERYFESVTAARDSAQIGMGAWVPDVPAAANFFNPLLTCSATESTNLSRFCDHRVDSLIRRASALELSDPAAAGRLWARVDQRVTAQAPWVPLISVRTANVVSKRLRNHAFHPVLGGFMISQARVR